MTADRARAVCPLYPDVSQDLVLAGIFLHDCGKTKELAYDTNIEYTDEGQLIGHITQAVIWVHERCRDVERETGKPFPSQLSDIPWETRPDTNGQPYHTGVNGMQDVSAITVDITVADPKSMLLITTNQLAQLAGNLIDFPQTNTITGSNLTQPGWLWRIST